VAIQAEPAGPTLAGGRRLPGDPRPPRERGNPPRVRGHTGCVVRNAWCRAARADLTDRAADVEPRPHRGWGVEVGEIATVLDLRFADGTVVRVRLSRLTDLARRHLADLRRARSGETASSWLSH
jgi:hypothetical protein